MRTVSWHDNHIHLIDQRLLPDRLEVLAIADVTHLVEAIRDMAVRGAPAIGAAAAYGVALAAASSGCTTSAGIVRDARDAADLLRAARPTAVNLTWAVSRVLRRVECEAEGGADAAAVRAAALDEAESLAGEDIETNRRMGALGAGLLPDPATVLHHCNTGALATVDYGTALGVVRAAHEAGRRVRVLVDETRPRLQGARLTCWELDRLGIDHALIVDGAAAHFLRHGGVDAVLVGADRIAANGDVANKIGTYGLAVCARAHDVPFYVVAPTSTIDPASASGDDIPVEMRSPEEITHLAGQRLAAAGTRALNPAFDVTPSAYVTAIVTEAGVVRPPYPAGLRDALGHTDQTAGRAHPRGAVS